MTSRHWSEGTGVELREGAVLVRVILGDGWMVWVWVRVGVVEVVVAMLWMVACCWS